MRVLFFTSTMDGGVGRVIAILNEALNKKGYKSDVLIIDKTDGSKKSLAYFFIMLKAAFVRRILGDYEKASVLKYYAKNYCRINKLKKIIKEYKKCCIVSFLNEPIFLTLLLKNKNHKVIISERNDPSKFTKNKTTMSFIHKMYPKADILVCQSPDAKKWYDDNSSVKSTVIFNPVKADLPLPYAGERRKKIVNFCRISTQKNLLLLVDAFEKLNQEYPDYELEIIGNIAGNGSDGYINEIKASISDKKLDDKIHILPGRNDIHDYIRDYAMFVSSSDFEGMSNSMLEAMTMGMPVVCTDCPAGGARAVIKDHENGLLTPVGDAEALYRAMKEIIENPALAKKLSENAGKIKYEQSVEKITEKWMEIINA